MLHFISRLVWSTVWDFRALSDFSCRAVFWLSRAADYCRIYAWVVSQTDVLFIKVSAIVCVCVCVFVCVCVCVCVCVFVCERERERERERWKRARWLLVVIYTPCI